MRAFRIITYKHYFSRPPCVLEAGVKLQVCVLWRWITIAVFKWKPDESHREKAVEIMNELQNRQEE